MATPSQIEANLRNAQKSTRPRTEEGEDRSRFHAVKHGMDASVPTPVVFQPVEPLTPTSLDAKSSTESPAPAKFEISQDEPNLVNIDRTTALNGDPRQDRGLEFNPVEPLMPPSPDAKSSAESPADLDFEISQDEPNLVNIDRTTALNGDNRQDRGLDLNPAEPLMPPSPGAKSSTESLAPAKFEISQNEANLVNIDRTKVLNGDHCEDRGLDFGRG